MAEKLNSGRSRGSSSLRRSDINWARFYTIGTGLYSVLTVLLHPITVIKVRQQVLNSGNAETVSAVSRGDPYQHQPKIRVVVHDILRSSVSDTGRHRSVLLGFRGMYRGVGIVLSLAVPARVLYIATLEGSREGIGDAMTAALVQSYVGPEEAHTLLPLVTTVSGGLSGGIAALVAQVFVVPMDVISQKQMVMDSKIYEKEGSALSVCRLILQTEGLRGLYRGFGLSMLSSLPTGSLWWATYSGCQHMLQSYSDLNDEDKYSASYLLQRGTVQLTSGLSAALLAAGLTQPLDTIKTRLQVDIECNKALRSSPFAVAKELADKSGFRGFYRGLVPRTMHMGLWGTVLSSAYEFLRHISRKDYHRQ